MARITFSAHAIDRILERRQCTHIGKHLHKIQSWGLPENGETEHKGWIYITRGGVLVTVYGSKEFRKKYKQDGKINWKLAEMDFQKETQ